MGSWWGVHITALHAESGMIPNIQGHSFGAPPLFFSCWVINLSNVSPLCQLGRLLEVFVGRADCCSGSCFQGLRIRAGLLAPAFAAMIPSISCTLVVRVVSWSGCSLHVHGFPRLNYRTPCFLYLKHGNFVWQAGFGPCDESNACSTPYK